MPPLLDTWNLPSHFHNEESSTYVEQPWHVQTHWETRHKQTHMHLQSLQNFQAARLQNAVGSQAETAAHLAQHEERSHAVVRAGVVLGLSSGLRDIGADLKVSFGGDHHQNPRIHAPCRTVGVENDDSRVRSEGV